MDGDPYDGTPGSIRSGPSNDGYSVWIHDKYNHNNPVGDRYTHEPGQGELDCDCNKLFAGYSVEKAGSGGRFFDGPPPRREPPPREEDDEDVEGIKSQM
jgi:protein transport protein SEC9